MDTPVIFEFANHIFDYLILHKNQHTKKNKKNRVCQDKKSFIGTEA